MDPKRLDKEEKWCRCVSVLGDIMDDSHYAADAISEGNDNEFNRLSKRIDEKYKSAKEDCESYLEPYERLTDVGRDALKEGDREGARNVFINLKDSMGDKLIAENKRFCEFLKLASPRYM